MFMALAKGDLGHLESQDCQSLILSAGLLFQSVLQAQNLFHHQPWSLVSTQLMSCHEYLRFSVSPEFK